MKTLIVAMLLCLSAAAAETNVIFSVTLTASQAAYLTNCAATNNATAAALLNKQVQASLKDRMALDAAKAEQAALEQFRKLTDAEKAAALQMLNNAVTTKTNVFDK